MAGPKDNKFRSRKPPVYDPYAQTLAAFNRQGVRYVVVGMSGINYYASKPEETFSTQDYDVFLNPTVTNVQKAVNILRGMEYDVYIGQEPVKDAVLKAVVRERRTITATDPYGISFDFLLAVSGFAFSRMAEDAAVFRVGNTAIKVGKLRKLLLSKKLAGRKKDRLFLKHFRAAA